MINNPKIGDYAWFVCRWTDMPTLGVITNLKVDHVNEVFPYEGPYAEVDWNDKPTTFENASTLVLLKDLYKTKQELLTALREENKRELERMVNQTLILSEPKHGWCTFRLKSDEGIFHAELSYLTDVMHDTLKMCLTYLQTGAAAVEYNSGDEGRKIVLIMTNYSLYILDENLESGMFHFENLNATDICQNILDSYYSCPMAWINFANMEDQDEAEYKKYEDAEAKEIHKMIKEIRRLLNEKTGTRSKWTEIRCDFFDEEEQTWLVDAWQTGDDDEEGVVIAKITEDGNVTYLDDEAKEDKYAQEVINDMVATIS